MGLKELLEAVRDEKLPLHMVEKYRDQLVHLHTDMQLELADLEKKEALFFLGAKGASGSESDVSIKRRWRGLPEGLRTIELNRELKAIAKEIDSLKSRVYRLI